MLLRSLPDLAQSTAEFQSWFQSKWGRENCIIWGRARQAEFGPCTHTLSIRAAWGGVEHCYVNGRTLAVDDDNFPDPQSRPDLQHQHPLGAAGRIAVDLLQGPSWPEQIYGEASASIEQALARGDTPAERSPDFMENLHPHENTVSPVLRFIRGAHQPRCARRGVVRRAAHVPARAHAVPQSAAAGAGRSHRADSSGDAARSVSAHFAGN
jgi:hypothetical protein